MSLEVRSEGAGMPSPFLRYGLVRGVPSGGDTSSFSLERGETGVWVYQEDVLQGLKHLNITLFSGQEWVFQQDSVPAQNQEDSGVVRRNVLAFISAKDWPSGSPDLNDLYYKLWTVLEDMACRKCHNNLDNLMRSLVKAAAGIPLEMVLAAIEWPEHLKACIGAQGGHFEWHYYK